MLWYGHKKSCSTLFEGNSFKLLFNLRYSEIFGWRVLLLNFFSNLLSGSSHGVGSSSNSAINSSSSAINNLSYLGSNAVNCILSLLSSTSARNHRHSENNSK